MTLEEIAAQTGFSVEHVKWLQSDLPVFATLDNPQPLLTLALGIYRLLSQQQSAKTAFWATGHFCLDPGNWAAAERVERHFVSFDADAPAPTEPGHVFVIIDDHFATWTGCQQALDLRELVRIPPQELPQRPQIVCTLFLENWYLSLRLASLQSKLPGSQSSQR